MGEMGWAGGQSVAEAKGEVARKTSLEKATLPISPDNNQQSVTQ